jgi:hypothetical protein
MLLKNRSITVKSVQEIIPLTIIGQTVRTRTKKFKNYSQEDVICVIIQITYHFTIVIYRSVNETLRLLVYLKFRKKCYKF